MTDLRLTPIVELQKYTEGELVQLPDFAEGQPFVAKLKRPSMLMMMKSGKIPNSLMNSAQTLFDGGNSQVAEDDGNDGFYKEVLEIIEILAEASFVAPTWQELKEAGIQLTDDQYIFLFNYVQRGVKALENFR